MSIDDEGNKNLENDEQDSEEEAEEDNEVAPLIVEQEVRVYKERWFALFILVMNSAVNGMLIISLSSVNNIVSKYYGVSSVYIEWLTNMMKVGYLIFALPASYLISRFGIRPLIITGACLHAITSVFQYLGHNSNKFWVLFFGQVFSAIGSTTILQVPGKLSAVWFHENGRATSTSIGALSHFLGAAIGFLHPTLMIKASHDKEKIKEELKTFFLIRMVICVLVMVLTFAYREKPPSPPSSGPPREKVSFVGGVRELLKNKYFILLSQSYGIHLGLNGAIGVLLNPIVTTRFPHGYEHLIGWMGFSYILAGALSFIVVGKLLDRWHKYQIASIFLNAASMVIWLIGFTTLMYTENFTAVFVLYVFAGAFILPFSAVGIEQAAEMTYPVSEETSSVVLMLLANVYGFIFIFAFGSAIQNQYFHVTGYVIAGLYCTSTLLASFSKTELNRLNAEYCNS